MILFFHQLIWFGVVVEEEIMRLLKHNKSVVVLDIIML